MKKYLQNPFLRKLLLIIILLIAVVIILDRLVLPWYVNEPERSVPKVIGLTETQAVEALENAGLEPVVDDTTFNEKFPKGTIILQKPEAGSVVKEGRRIYLFLSGGEPTVIVPQLKGKSLRDARFTLERLGLTLGTIDEQPSDNPKDMIFDQQYAAGTPLKKGRTVGVTISTGSETGEIGVPDLIGKSLSEAEKVLADSSLKVGKINYQRSFSLLPNTILDQYPSKGSKVPKGAEVDLFVTTSVTEDENEIMEE